MAEYIEREAAIAAAFSATSLGNSAFRDVYDTVSRLRLIPAADVRPMVRGQWAKELHPNVHYNQYKCSICGEFSGHDSEGWIWAPNFCPNCGADMRPEPPKEE